MRRGARRGHLVREVALSVGALLGVVCLLATLAGTVFDVRPLIFRSGSMSPGIPTGSLGLAQTVDADRLAPGDVVSVFSADGTRITHRVVSLQPAGAAVSLVLQGDDNRVPDPEPYVVTEADRLFWSAPGLGYVVSALSGRTAAFAGGILTGVLAVVVVGRRREPRSDPDRPDADVDVPADLPADLPDDAPVGAPGEAAAGRVGRVAGRLVLGLVIGAVLVPIAQPGRAYAAWDDTALARNTFTTVTVPTTTMTCTAAVTTVTFRWTAVSGASYLLTIRRPDGTVFSTTPIAAGTTSITASGLLSSGSAFIQAVRYTGSWTSVPSNVVTFTLGLSCG